MPTKSFPLSRGETVVLSYRFQNFGETVVALIAVFSISSMRRLATTGLTATHSTTVDLIVDGVIINKEVIGQHKIQ